MAREILEAHAIDEADFRAIRMISGWACSRVDGFSPDKKALGRMAKTLLDLGRCIWIKKELPVGSVSFNVYVDPDVTPENFVILADA